MTLFIYLKWELKFQSLSKFQLYNTGLWTVVTVLYIRSSECTILVSDACVAPEKSKKFLKIKKKSSKHNICEHVENEISQSLGDILYS